MTQDDIECREPLWREIPFEDPGEAARRFAGSRHFTFLDSALASERLGRFSCIACDPVETIGAEDFSNLAPRLKSHALRHIPDLPPFQGGFAGYVAYEFGRELEAQIKAHAPAANIPALMLHAYDVVLAFDTLARRAFVISTGYPETDEAKRLARAETRMAEMTARLARPKTATDGPRSIANWTSNFARPAYEEAILKTVEYILAGDIFQANISQRFSSPIPDGFDPFAFYMALRQRNAATFAAFLDYGDVVIASASPERLFAFDGVTAEARPIKGTVRRDADPIRDSALKQELMASRKDRAENVMIVDLLRNDLSRVCDPGTVEVPVLCGLETYATVHHLVSSVTGRLSAGHSAVDLLAACFPGGSITGAPKIRAVEIIAETEKRPRDIYCGSIGFIGFSGRSDFNICIRTVLFHDGVASFGGGGGITAKSEPGPEYEETITKVSRILDVFGAAVPA